MPGQERANPLVGVDDDDRDGQILGRDNNRVVWMREEAP